MLSRAWFVAVSNNEASGADKTKKPQRMSSFPQDQEELGQGIRQWDGVEGQICAVIAAKNLGDKETWLPT